MAIENLHNHFNFKFLDENFTFWQNFASKKKKAKCFLSFWRGWELISHQVPKQVPTSSSCSHQNPFVLIMFPKNSHQIPLVPINNPSISFCSHQVPEQFPSRFPLFPSSSDQHRFVPMAMKDRQVSTGERALRWTVRDSGRVLNGCGRAESRDFLPARFCGRARADLLLARQSATLLPWCVRFS